MSTILDNLVTQFTADASGHVRAAGEVNAANLAISKSAEEAGKRLIALLRPPDRALAPAVTKQLKLQAISGEGTQDYHGPDAEPTSIGQRRNPSVAELLQPPTKQAQLLTQLLSVAPDTTAAGKAASLWLASMVPPQGKDPRRWWPKTAGHATNAIELEMASEHHRLLRRTLGAPAESSHINRNALPPHTEYDRGISQIEIHAIKSQNRHPVPPQPTQTELPRSLGRNGSGLGKLIEQAIADQASAIAYQAITQFIQQNYGR